MKNFKNEFENKLRNEEITLPESLSAENIEKLINEKGGIVTPKRIVSFPKKKVAQWVSVAAIFVILVGVTAVLGLDNMPVQKENQNINPEQQQVIIEEHAAEPSDYSEIHKTVLSYYKDIYNQTYYYTQSDSDGIFNGFFDNFGAKNEAAMDMVVGNNSSDLSSSAQNVPSAAPESSSPAQDDAGHSTTNTQVQGVDEADIVKTDGEYIYFARTLNNEIVITKCTDPENLFISSRISLSEDGKDIIPVEIFLHGDTLVLIARKFCNYDISDVFISSPVTDACCTVLRSDTIVKMYDITNKEEPRETYSVNLSGEYVSSRIAEGRLVLVTRFDIPYNSVRASDFDDACQAMKEICIPEYSINNGAMQRIPADRINMLGGKTPSSYAITAVTDLGKAEKETKFNAFLGNVADIYCTKDELFIAEEQFSYWMPEGETVVKDSDGREFQAVTKIMRMALTSDGAEYISDVTVGGTCINQFSMDKNGDYFRIATIGTKYNENLRESIVYIIDKDMKITGYLDGIAKGEDMKAARFLGNSLYLVTFMQTDPLFVVDLSDVTKPEVRGELKIPGFSTYLHPIGDGLVIGLGEGGSMSGTDGTAKISLFDVSDPNNPKELDNYTTNDFARFTGGHKGFITFDENTYAVSVEFGVSSGIVIMFSIENRSIVIHESYIAMSGAIYNENTRGVFIGNFLFVVNNAGIVSYDITEDFAFDKDRLSFF